MRDLLDKYDILKLSQSTQRIKNQRLHVIREWKKDFEKRLVNDGVFVFWIDSSVIGFNQQVSQYASK